MFDRDSLGVLFQLGDLMPGGFFIYRADESQELLYINQAALQIFGCETQEQFRALTGFTFRGLVCPEDYEEIQASIDRQIAEVANGKFDFVKYRITRRDGAVRWISDYGRLVEIPGLGAVYFVFIADATERQRLREEQHRMELALARERERTEIKSSFLFNMSHDLRTPLNAALGFTQLARRRLADDPAAAADYLDRAQRAGRQLDAQLDDLLEMNSLEAGEVRLRPEPSLLREQLALALDLLRPEAARKGITLAEELELPEERLLVDQSRFRRVFSNLLSNAVKFTPPGGTVTLSARCSGASQSGYARYTFCVADTGVGMSREFMEQRLFQPFEREGCATETGKAGTGLGLSIVKSILDRMGGTVWARSRKGEGASFFVELPLKSAAEAENAPPAAPETHAEGECRVLVVEDIPINRLLLESLLEDEGFLVESVPDGSDAVEAVRTHAPGHYDLVLMDIQMPVMNGYEATRLIRALPREDCARLPILALSANSREEDRRRSRESGMNGHMAKPFEIDSLASEIRRLVQENRESA